MHKKIHDLIACAHRAYKAFHETILLMNYIPLQLVGGGGGGGGDAKSY